MSDTFLLSTVHAPHGFGSGHDCTIFKEIAEFRVILSVAGADPELNFGGGDKII